MPSNHAYLLQKMRLKNEIIDATRKGDSAREKKARAKLKAIDLKIQGKNK